jgi:hypothetical protein
MTDHLYISFKYNQEDISNLRDEIVKQVKLRCLSDVPNNHLSGLRMNTSKSDGRILFEPYFGAAALGAHLTIKKYRPNANKVLFEIIRCLQLVSNTIEILFLSDGCQEEIQSGEKAYEINEVLNFKVVPFQTKFLIRTPKVFHVLQAEFELDEPIEVSTDQIANRYFRNYYICADDEKQAIEHVLEKAGSDTFLGYRAIDELLPISLPKDLQAIFDIEETGVFYESGRVLF